ncbi:MAG: CHAT domain-containing tetratricopeptide repeat protein [Bacteroidota bacterium]
MIRRDQLLRLFICIFISAGCLHASEIHCTYISSMLFSRSISVVNSIPIAISNSSKEVDQLNVSLKSLLISGDYTGSRLIVDRIIQKIRDINIDDKSLSESYYFIGVYHSLTRSVHEAIRYFNLCISLKDKNHEYDERYANTLYNLGVLYGRLGDFKRLEDYSMRSLEVEKKFYGDTSPFLISAYSSLITAYIELQEYEKSLNFANIALSIANSNMEVTNSSDMVNLYNNLGVLYIYLADFSKAKIYLDKSESIYKNSHLDLNENYINLMNSMAITYGALSLAEKSDEYYEKGIALAVSNNSSIAYNIVNSYAIILGNAGKEKKGEALLSGALVKAKTKFGEDSRGYFEVLNNYADYLREHNIDNNKSLEYYVRCMDYLNKNDQDLSLKTSVYIGYSLSLAEAGEPHKALETVQPLLFSDYGKNQGAGTYDNPDIETIKPDKKSLKILKTKYEILWEIYKKSQDQKTLEAASGTAELIVSLLGKVRINISEEESRLVLGDRYRDSYLNAIWDFNLLYSKTADRQFLEKAFEYAEKSKVAGLLTSTRELKAAQFHIPSDIADFEKKLQRDISLFNVRIAEESVSEEPDTVLINKWNENLLEATRKRDSMILVFEKQYPGYYAIKYNTQVADLKDIPEIAGRNGNYINYVVSDTILYIFVANRKHQQLLAIPVDSSFYNNIRQFRNLLSIPSPSDNAKIAFRKYQSIGYELYKTLIDPVRPYLISDKILISPDNILSYLPFETLPTSPDSGERILYREIAYMMNDFDISYTYSATFMAESVRKEYSIGNKVIAFAPNYPEPIDVQSVLMNRQAETGILPDLPYARQEAEYVSDITGGKLFLNDEARESVYKAESGKYDIIHLAMHTILNDKDPMNSTLIFSPEIDTIDDRYLKTYEVYGIPLKAKMVVLSSCNTGTGFLYSGEGILSLARGFIYSGSQSVVMSMWEIEDRSGTEIVKMFYENLKKGNSKSVALRKARIAYLKKSDQLRSHPYFWSTLVIYGNNTPLYYSKHLIIAAVIFAFIVFVSLILYFRKRKYS